jgi:hypothetical protein
MPPPARHQRWPTRKENRTMSAVLTPIQTIFDPLAQAVQDYVEAKAARLQAEERILALKPAWEEGASSFEAGGFHVTTTGKLGYACDDPKALAEACAAAQWSPSMIPVKTVVELDATGAKWLRANEPEAWRLVAKFVTVKPAKTAIKVSV